jgi:futalosine hydrolase
MNNIWIVAAVESELERLKVELTADSTEIVARCPCYRGQMGRHIVNLAVVGVGMVSASLVLGELAARSGARQVIMIGSSGAFPDAGLCVGDLVVALSETFAELGLCSGPGVGDSDALGLTDLEQEIQLDRDVAHCLAEAAGEYGAVSLGGFLSVAGVSADLTQAKARQDRFHALVENMEGYALALAGRRFGIRVGEVRGVSNMAGDRDKASWCLGLANERAQQAVLGYLRRTL